MKMHMLILCTDKLVKKVLFFATYIKAGSQALTQETGENVAVLDTEIWMKSDCAVRGNVDEI
jgi:hypothetical protein